MGACGSVKIKIYDSACCEVWTLQHADNGIDSAVITMNVVSLMDETVFKKGSYSFTRNKKKPTPRLDYGDA